MQEDEVLLQMSRRLQLRVVIWTNAEAEAVAILPLAISKEIALVSRRRC